MENSLLNLMMQHPYQDITVTDICRNANIPRRTFYHYFDSKEDILDSVIEEMMQQCFLEGMFEIHLDVEHMEQHFVRIFRFWDESNRRKLDALIREGLESRLIALSSRWVRKEQIGAVLNSVLDPKLMEISVLVGITDFFTLLFYWSRGGYQETPEQMAKYAAWIMNRTIHSNL